MKTPFLLVLALASISLFASCGSSGSDKDPTRSLGGSKISVDYRDPAALKALVEGADPSSFILVDVRTAEEFAEGHIPGSVNIPYERIGSTPPTDDKDALIIVYCRSGRRSAIAAEALKAAGYDSIVDFGGIDRYRGPLER